MKWYARALGQVMSFVLVIALGVLSFPAHYVQAATWSSAPYNAWTYRKSHVITGSTGAGTSYQVKLVIHYGSGTDSGSDVYLNSHSNVDFSDIRFASSDGTTDLPYWVETETDSSVATVWVKVAEDLGSDRTIYIYYGNAGASTASNGTNTFIFFDDFSGPSLDTGNWTKFNNPTATQSGGILSVSSTNSDPTKIILTGGPQTDNVALRARFRVTGGVNVDQRAGLGVKTNTSDGAGYNYVFHDFSSLTTREFLNDAIAWGTAFTESWSKNTWYVEDIFHDGTNVRGRFDDGTWRVWANSGRTGFLALNVGGFMETVTTEWDYALVRKSIVTEPTNSTWGTEDTNAGGSSGRIIRLSGHLRLLGGIRLR
jgi:hypothetical protein